MKKGLCLVVALGLLGSTFGAAYTFTGAVCSDWGTAGNWDPEGVPGKSTWIPEDVTGDVLVNYVAARPEGCTIFSGDYLIGNLIMSRYAGAATDPDAILNCTSGSLTTAGYYISMGYASRPTAVINVYDGFALNQNASGGTILGAGGDAVINMYGGTFDNTGGGVKIAATAGTGELNIYGGVFTQRVWGSGSANLVVGAVGKINIGGDGVLKLYGTNHTFVTGLIADGKLAAMSGNNDDIEIVYDAVENYTYVSVPEPATLLMLGVGGFLASRRNRR